MEIKLTQKQRLLVAILYLLTLIFVYQGIGGDIGNLIGKQSNDNAIWFFSGALMIVLGKYLVETYFTKPADAVVNAVAVISALVLISNKEVFFGYYWILGYVLFVLFLAGVCIATNDSQNNILQKISKFCYVLVGALGKSVVIFSIIYLSASYSYFGTPDKFTSFNIAIILWVFLVFFDIFGLLVKSLCRAFNLLSKEKVDTLGIAIGCENPLLYKVEIDLAKHKANPNIEYGAIIAIETSKNIGALGMVIDKKYLLGKRWLSVYLFSDENGDPLTMGLLSRKMITDSNSIFGAVNCAYTLEFNTLHKDQQELISENSLYKNKDSFVGYVTRGSNINTINFSVIKNTENETKRIAEGSILETTIYGEEVIYQVINGNTEEEHLENKNTHGFTIGVARKLGHYNYTGKFLDVKKWMPAIYTPVFFSSSAVNTTPERLKEIGTNSIGRLPSTDLEIPIGDIHSLVTHNTAILGILGIGKSYLTFELIKKLISSTNVKVICIDITGEYNNDTKGLPLYINKNLITSGVDEINEKLEEEQISVEDSKDDGGHMKLLKELLYAEIDVFMKDDTKKIKVINPEEIMAIQQVDHAKNRQKNGAWEMYAPFAELTIPETTRVIAECALDYVKKQGMKDEATLLLVLEEAHSLVSEWNSASNDGDKNASNGTAKVILQGRKYGLGSFVITQRTANISKSVLNQCNTIFALRIFDDTGKQFLENYIGSDYAKTLSVLEERHAVAIGKALKLKQPVIISLNDRGNVV